MKANRLLISILLILLLITDVTLFKRNTILTDEITIKDQAIISMNRKLRQLELTELNLKANYTYGHTNISNRQITNSDNIQYSLSDIIDKPTLILRYDSHACSECISFAINKLSEIKNTNIPVLILSSYDTLLEMKRLSPMVNSIYAPIYNITDDILDLDKNGLPYYCMIDKDCNIYQIFIPEKGIATATTDFLNTIKVQ